jgi:hypothetical protein
MESSFPLQTQTKQKKHIQKLSVRYHDALTSKSQYLRWHEVTWGDMRWHEVNETYNKNSEVYVYGMNPFYTTEEIKDLFPGCGNMSLGFLSSVFLSLRPRPCISSACTSTSFLHAPPTPLHFLCLSSSGEAFTWEAECVYVCMCRYMYLSFHNLINWWLDPFTIALIGHTAPMNN